MDQTSSTLEYFVEPAKEQLNGKPETNHQVKDNRLQLLVDGRQVETWELIVMEERVISGWIMVFARYLARGDKFISPGLPNKPFEDLSRAEKSQIENSEAYKILKHMKAPALKAASDSFIKQATSFGDDPN